MDWPVCKLQVCNLVFNEFAQAEQQKVNKHPKFDANFDIRRQLDHLTSVVTIVCSFNSANKESKY